jgi:hypothetical protein
MAHQESERVISLQIYYGNWDSFEDMKNSFEEEIPDTIEVIYASYSIDSYEGEAFVLFRQNGEYFEVNGSHCSCYGLEGQWSPERVDLPELIGRISRTKQHYDGGDELLDCLLFIQAGEVNQYWLNTSREWVIN